MPTPGGFVPTKDNKPTLTYDPEWLAITRAFHPYLSQSRTQAIYPEEGAARGMIEKELEWIKSHVRNNKNEGSKVGIRDVADCQAFVMTAPGPGSEGEAKFQQRESTLPCACVPRCRAVTYYPGRSDFAVYVSHFISI